VPKFVIKKRLHLYFSSTRSTSLTWDPKVSTLTVTKDLLTLKRKEGEVVVDRSTLDYYILETVKLEVKKPEAQTLDSEEEAHSLFIDD